ACLLNAVGAEDCRESGERAAACREVVARCDHPARRSAGGVEEGVGEASSAEGQVGEVLQESETYVVERDHFARAITVHVRHPVQCLIAKVDGSPPFVGQGSYVAGHVVGPGVPSPSCNASAARICANSAPCSRITRAPKHPSSRNIPKNKCSG